MNQNLEQHNLAFLQRYFPSLAAQLSSGGFPESVFGNVEVVPGRKGKPTARILAGNDWKIIHSQYDPIHEAARWVASNPPPPGCVVVIAGWGLGYHIVEWVKQHGKNVDAIIAIEPETKLFLHSLSAIDFHELTNVSRLEIVLGQSGSAIYGGFLRCMDLLLNRDLKILPLPFAPNYPADFFSTLQSEVEKLLRNKSQMLKHMAEQGARCQANIVQNIPNMARSFLRRDWPNIMAKQPAIVVAAGPSLNRNVSQLVGLKNNAWIFSTDTATRVLNRHGVIPDFVVTKDPTDLNATHFESLELSEASVLAFDPQVHPSIPQRHSGKLFCMPNRNPDLHRYLQGLELQEQDRLPLSSNVALAAFNLAVSLGCDPVIFAGLDLCFPANGASHAEGTVLQSQVLFDAYTNQMQYSRGMACDTVSAILVEGIDGKSYPTTTTFHEALRLLETLIRDSGVRCIDASEGGAKIGGTEVLTLKETAKQFCLQTLDKSFVPKMPILNRKVQDLIQSISRIADHLVECSALCVEGSAVLESEENCIHDRCGEIREYMERDFRIYHELQAVLERLIVETYRPGFWDVSDDALMENYRWYFDTIGEACRTYAPMFRGAAGRLECA